MVMQVKARLIGGDSDKGYLVNVRNANPKGMIGDAGVIRKFKDKHEAQSYVDLVNSTGQDVFVKTDKNGNVSFSGNAGKTDVKNNKKGWFWLLADL